MVDIRAARSEDAAAIARVHVASWRSTYRGMMPDSVLDSLDYGQREAYWRESQETTTQGAFVIVADDGGTIVGFASGGPQRNPAVDIDAELYTIYLLAERQGQGIGRQLLRAAIETLQAAGFSSMGLWVLKDNPAEQFYAAMGGIRQAKVEEFELGGETLLEVAYVWPDLVGWLDVQA